ncbi:P-loop containing nucleoside triphosphate hydrolase protein [Mycena olivaceomarginata]|nr:P-loop containing nucleoside triphosphate hydrolase protein [Mycena olivaceomarginata]
MSPVNFFARHPIFFPPEVSASGVSGAVKRRSCDTFVGPQPKRLKFLDDNHRDLDSKTPTELRVLLTLTIEKGEKIEEADIFIRKGIENLYKQRVSAIKAALAANLSTPPDELWHPSASTEEEVDNDFMEENTKISEVLRRYFGIEELRKQQIRAIKKTMAGQDVFVLLPTGAGKSLCFQLPAVLAHEEKGAVTVVVSPLRSLIHDQVAALEAKSVKVLGLDGETASSVIPTSLVNARSKPALIYCTPEKITNSEPLHRALVHLHRSGKMALFAIDEAHCITQWGKKSYRTNYGQLHTLREDFPGVPIMALTSTATPQNVADIGRHLKLQNPSLIRQSLNRPNLTYTVKPKRNQIDELVKFIQDGHKNHCGIIYRTGKNQCEELARILGGRGIQAKSYHANLPNKDEVHAQWKNDEFKIVVATIAFGMGIDKANVRFVVHYDMPSSLESYYQETGRAGRDGEPADCCLFYSFRHKKVILDLNNKEGPARPSDETERQVSAIVEFCEEKTHFDKKDCGDACDNCANAGLLVSRDLSTQASLAVRLVHTLEEKQDQLTVPQCIEVLRGQNTEHTRKNGRNRNPLFGAGRKLTPDLARLLFDKLLYRDALVEQKVHTYGVHFAYYLKLGRDSADFFENQHTPIVTVAFHAIGALKGAGTSKLTSHASSSGNAQINGLPGVEIGPEEYEDVKEDETWDEK